jgi:hypothetical protein
VSLQLRNELHIRVGPQRCEANILRAGLGSQRGGQAQVLGTGSDTLDGVLGALVAEGHGLPRRASVCVEDEFLYYATLPAAGKWRDAHTAACDYFEGMVGDQGLLVETSMVPCGTTWVAVAIDAAMVQQWREVLAGRDIELAHVRAALLEDLWMLRPQLPKDDGLVVMVRDEGASLVHLVGGCIRNIHWERCDTSDGETLASRIEGYRSRFAGQSNDGVALDLPPTVVVPPDATMESLLQKQASQHGWALISALRPARA